MMGVSFQALPASTFVGTHSLREYTEPTVFRGLAADWPAVQSWSFAQLAANAPDLSVKLVDGDRESGHTCLRSSTLRAYLESLSGDSEAGGPSLYLKEFDLLKAIPGLTQDLGHTELFPKGALRSQRSWIGPAGARTGLHYDYLNNVAVQIVGKKRLFLVRPGTVERVGAVARKYDAWATLSQFGAEELFTRVGTPGDFFTVNLEAGDVLHIPAGWWHEVLNLTPSILFGGFYDSPARTLLRWAWVSSRDVLHYCGWLGKGNCTCHATENQRALL